MMKNQTALTIQTAGHFHQGWKSCRDGAGCLPGLADHPDHRAAKYEGDAEAALRVVKSCLGQTHLTMAKIFIDGLRMKGMDPILVPSYRKGSQNRIATTLAEYLGEELGVDVDKDIKAEGSTAQKDLAGVSRIFNTPHFTGKVHSGKTYVLVDDYVHTGGSLNKLKNYIESQGGRVVFGFALASPSGQMQKIEPASDDQISNLEKRFSSSVVNWMKNKLGDLHLLTRADADYVLNHGREMFEAMSCR